MKANSFRFIAIFLSLFAFSAAASAQDQKDDRIFEFDFNETKQGWRAEFADSTSDPVNREQVVFKRKKLPANLEGGRKTLFIGGTNQTDDLFMFIMKRLKGLKPNTTYSIRFNIQIATNASSGCVGAGGSPGESVVLKAGASSIKPEVDPATRLLNLDKGNQSQGGRDLFVLGNIANTSTDCLNPVYEFKILDSQTISFEAAADSLGKLWIVVGTDSGFESRTELYYSRVSVRLIEK